MHLELKSSLILENRMRKKISKDFLWQNKDTNKKLNQIKIWGKERNGF